MGDGPWADRGFESHREHCDGGWGEISPSVGAMEGSIQWWISGLENRARLTPEGSIPLSSALSWKWCGGCLSRNTPASSHLALTSRK